MECRRLRILFFASSPSSPGSGRPDFPEALFPTRAPAPAAACELRPPSSDSLLGHTSSSASAALAPAVAPSADPLPAPPKARRTALCSEFLHTPRQLP